MRILIDQADRRFLAELNRLGPSRISEICEALSVTATAVRNRLARLQEKGCVERTTVRSDRGRPHHVYRPTSSGLRQLGDNYDELTPLLWQEISELKEVTVRKRLMARLRSALVERYRQAVTAPDVEQRVRQLQHELESRGFDVEVGEPDAEGKQLPILRENNCPYHELASRDGSICELEQSVFEEVLGVPISRTHCCREGDSCCEFEPAVVG